MTRIPRYIANNALITNTHCENETLCSLYITRISLLPIIRDFSFKHLMPKTTLFSLLFCLCLGVVANPCEDPTCDNSAVTREARCGLASIDYYQFVPAFLDIKDLLNLQPIKVAVIDTGLDLSTDQFDDVRLTNVMGPNSTRRNLRDIDAGRHGTGVASIIAADNDGAGTNGIASRLLGDNLQLIIGRNYGRSVPTQASRQEFQQAVDGTIDSVRRAIRAGAKIINLSFGAEPSFGREGLEIHRAAWESFLRQAEVRNPDVLFIAAASNTPMMLSNTNDAPAGMQFSNLITVGGYDSCKLSERPRDSLNRVQGAAQGRAGVIHVAGPYSDHVRIGWDSDTNRVDVVAGEGNSYAAAVVTSMAAIMKSVEPSLTVAHLKHYLTDSSYTWPTDNAIGGKRVALIKTVGGFLVDRRSNIGEVMDIFDATPVQDGQVDDPGLVASRACPHTLATLNITDSSSHAYQSTIVAHDLSIALGSANHPNGAMFGAGVGNLSFGDRSRLLNIGLLPSHNFLIGSAYTIGTDIVSNLMLGSFAGAGSLTMWNITHYGDASHGTLIFNGCEITTRSLDLNHFSVTNEIRSFVQVWGSMQARYAVRDVNDPNASPVTWNGQVDFHWPVALGPISDTLKEFFESNCHGGYNYSPP